MVLCPAMRQVPEEQRAVTHSTQQTHFPRITLNHWLQRAVLSSGILKLLSRQSPPLRQYPYHSGYPGKLSGFKIHHCCLFIVWSKARWASVSSKNSWQHWGKIKWKNRWQKYFVNSKTLVFLIILSITTSRSTDALSHSGRRVTQRDQGCRSACSPSYCTNHCSKSTY